jgi:hypothetical protein
MQSHVQAGDVKLVDSVTVPITDDVGYGSMLTIHAYPSSVHCPSTCCLLFTASNYSMGVL